MASTDSEAPKVDMPSEADLQQLPEEERLMQAAQAAMAAKAAQGMVDSLKSQASSLTDPKERERLLSETYNKEVEANGLSKKARILKSGAFQGAAGGVGIGAAAGLGLGTLVGTVVGTVVSVPTTALGGLIGAGTGAIHGPWIKLGGGENKGEGGGGEEKVVQVSQAEIDSGAVQVDDDTGRVTVRDPEALREGSSSVAAVSNEQKSVTGGDAGKKKRRKPRKLEIRSNKGARAGKDTA